MNGKKHQARLENTRKGLRFFEASNLVMIFNFIQTVQSITFGYIAYCAVEIMPQKKKSSVKKNTRVDTALSSRTKKQIDSLPTHAQHIFKKAHANAVKEYQNPEKRRGGKKQNAEEVAHKTAWAAVKKKYKKQGDEWVSK